MEVVNRVSMHGQGVAVKVDVLAQFGVVESETRVVLAIVLETWCGIV